MKRLFTVLLTLCLTALFVACTTNNTPENADTEIHPFSEEQKNAEAQWPPLEGKIAIITVPKWQDLETNYSAQHIVDKYGKDMVMHITWPDRYKDETKQVISIVEELGQNTEIKAIIASNTVTGMNACIDKLSETRPDVFIVYCQPSNEPNIAQVADLIIGEDFLGTGQAMVEQAQKMGAKTFIYYSSSRFLAYPVIFEMRKRIKEKCEELNIEFLNAGELDMPSAQINLNVDKYIQIYGKDTAFYCPGVIGNIIGEVVTGGAILPQPWNPSPYIGFPEILGIRWPDGKSFFDAEELMPLDYLISEATRIAAEKGFTGRLSTWPVPANMLNTVSAAEYAIKWINGEVPKEGVDVEVLKQLMEDYAGVRVYLTPYTDKYPYTADVDAEVLQQIKERVFSGEAYSILNTDEYPYPYADVGTGEIHENFLLMRMDYITF